MEIMDCIPTVDVSIVVANYNQAKYVGQFIESIIHSSHQPREVLIIDDASSDNSLEVINKYLNYQWLKVIRLTQNKGFVEALNTGIKRANSTYIMRLDPDDYITPDRIRKQYTYLQEHPEVDMIGSNVQYVDKHGKELFKSNVPITHHAVKSYFKRGELPIFHGSIMGRTRVFKDILYRPHIRKAQDYDFFCRLLQRGYMLRNSSEYLTYYRMHTTNISDNDLLATCKAYSTIREEVFKSPPYSIWKLYSKYYHLLFYRKALHSMNKWGACFFLFLSALSQPNKVLRRFNYRSCE